MATGMKNAKSQMISTRVPHEIVEAIETVRQSDETMPTFVITAFRNEIARRQAGGAAESSLVSALDALKRVKEIGNKAGEEINALIDVAEAELQRKKPEPASPATKAPRPKPAKKPVIKNKNIDW